MENMESSKTQLLTGYLAVAASIVCNDLSSTCTQALQGAVPDFQLSMARSIVQLLFLLMCAGLSGYDLRIKAETVPKILYLGAAFVLYNVGMFGATTYVPLAEMYGVVMVGVIISSFLHSKLVFNKDIRMSCLISAFVCVIGIILATQPRWLFFDNLQHSVNMTMLSLENMTNDSKPIDEFGKSSQNGMILGYSLAFTGGVGFGLSFDISGILLKDVKPIVKALYAASFCVVASGALMFYTEDPVLTINTTDWMLVLGHTLLSIGAYFFSIQGAHYLPGPTMSVLYCFEVILMLICQYTIMHSIQPGNYNWIEVLGCVVIALGASISSVPDILALRAKANEL